MAITSPSAARWWKTSSRPRGHGRQPTQPLTAARNLYNGNIARQYTSVAKLSPVAGSPGPYYYDPQ